eukprot:TRINITY_DN22692_c4_g1_i1.p2 TRINITY_DN22692_c4_g1~~TRINITY_DN22692_c4_g1_i1.p2  ORF type:complete len:202 (+),score=27.36 TRINITY_DN22692_c4_g1_i1:82-687(+)
MFPATSSPLQPTVVLSLIVLTSFLAIECSFVRVDEDFPDDPLVVAEFEVPRVFSDRAALVSETHVTLSSTSGGTAFADDRDFFGDFRSSNIDISSQNNDASLGLRICDGGMKVLEHPLGVLLTISFMALRVAVALRSVSETSDIVLCMGWVIACCTRFIAENVAFPPNTVYGLLALVALCGREFVHMYGLRLVLRRFPIGC